MSDLTLDLDTINFDINSDYYDSFETLDQFLTNDFVQPFDDKFESNLSANTYQQTNNGFNSLQNQVFNAFNGYTDYNNIFFNNQSTGPPISHTFNQSYGQNYGQALCSTFGQTFVQTVGQTTGLIDSTSVNPIASISSTFGETIHQNQRQKETMFGHNSTVGFINKLNDLCDTSGQQSLFQQKTCQPFAKEVVETETHVNQYMTAELPESVTQLNGRLITDDEFREQNHSELLCAEGMGESRSSFGSDSPPLVISKDVEKDNNNNKVSKIVAIPVVKKLRLTAKPTPIRPKTYSRIGNGSYTTLTANTSDMSKETIAAVKGLVMLSNSCRSNTIRCQGVKKGFLSDLSFAERQELKRERNRIAAKKCRQKKLETIDKLEQMKAVLIEENNKFEEHLKAKRKLVLDIKLDLLKHRLNGCQLQQK